MRPSGRARRGDTRAPRRGRSRLRPSRPSRSAIVRATRSTRSWPRPLRSRRTASCRACAAASGSSSGTLAAGQPTVHVAVAERAGAGEPAAAGSARAFATRRAHGVRAPAGGRGAARARAAPPGRPGRPGRCGRAAGRSAAAGSARARPRCSGIGPARRAARAAVARRHEHRVRREVERALPPHDRRRGRPRAAGAAPRARRAANSGELVEEQHAAVGQRDLARHGRRAAADQPLRARSCGGARGTAARGAAGPSPSPATLWICVTSSASSNVRRRQDPRQAPRQHRLARPGRADHEQVVAARGGDLQRPLRRRPGPRTSRQVQRGLPAARPRGWPGAARSGRQRRAAGPRSGRAIGTPMHLHPVHQRRLGGVLLGHEQARDSRSAARRAPLASAPRTGRSSPAERQLAADRARARAAPAAPARWRRARRPRSPGRSPARPCARARARG